MADKSAAVWPDRHDTATGPLRGVRVLDLTTVVMGPSATQILGDLGADVVKVETQTGDTMRLIGPWRHEGMGPLFLQSNRNKQSVVLDLKTPEGKQAIVWLANRADVLVSNVRPQGLARLGLDYDSVRAGNDRIIYCVAVGYGSDGPQSGKPVYDDLMQAASGIAGLFRAVDGAPRYAPLNICDRVVGLYVANAITRPSKCRCSKPWHNWSWRIIWEGARLLRRWVRWDISDFYRGRADPTQQKTATYRLLSIPTGIGAISRGWSVAPILWTMTSAFARKKAERVTRRRLAIFWPINYGRAAIANGLKRYAKSIFPPARLILSKSYSKIRT